MGLEKIKKFLKIFHIRVDKSLYYATAPTIIMLIVLPFYSHLWILTLITALITALTIPWELQETIQKTIILMKFNVGDFVIQNNRHGLGYNKTAKVLDIDYVNGYIIIEFFEFVFRGSAYTNNGMGVAGRCGQCLPEYLDVVDFNLQLLDEEEEYEEEDED